MSHCYSQSLDSDVSTHRCTHFTTLSKQDTFDTSECRLVTLINVRRSSLSLPTLHTKQPSQLLKCKVLPSSLPPLLLLTSFIDYAITHNLTPFISMQNQYSLLYREEEREMFPALKQFGVGSIPWSPLARGTLTHSWKEKTKRRETDSYMGSLADSKHEEIVNR